MAVFKMGFGRREAHSVTDPDTAGRPSALTVRASVLKPIENLGDARSFDRTTV